MGRDRTGEGYLQSNQQFFNRLKMWELYWDVKAVRVHQFILFLLIICPKTSL
jgi:hypothetical protein